MNRHQFVRIPGERIGSETKEKRFDFFFFILTKRKTIFTFQCPEENVLFSSKEEPNRPKRPENEKRHMNINGKRFFDQRQRETKFCVFDKFPQLLRRDRTRLKPLYPRSRQRRTLSVHVVHSGKSSFPFLRREHDH